MKTIEYKVSFEKMISRIPGLFAYLDTDEFGNVSLYKATDSMDGCWGRIVENIKLPSTVNLETILVGGETYTFRTIIDYYYQYREELGADNSFVEFIDRGIGKIEVPNNIRDIATPKYLYLSNVKSLYNELVKMKKTCDFYHENQNKGLIEEDAHLCCICEKYKNLGGDTFMEYVRNLISEAETIAEEYLGYADVNKSMTLDFDVDLVSTHQDLGIMTPYAPIWIPGKKYLVGDTVEYNGDLYKCTEENTGKWDDDFLTIIFDESKFTKIDPVFIDMHEDNYTEKTINSVGEIWYDGEAIKHIAQNRDIGKGKKDYDIDLSFPLQIKGTTDSKLVDLRRFATYYNDNGVAERPIIGEDWLFYYRKGVVTNIQTINDNLGNVVKLSNLEETSENPNDLAAYGDVIDSITANDQEHTITFIYRIGVHLKSEENPTIVYDDDNNKLVKWKKFVWDGDTEIGIKYTETYNYEEGSDIDDLIRNRFEPKDETNNVIGTFTFNDYINGEYDEMIPTYKFQFTTINNTFNYDKTIAYQDVNIVSLLTDYEKYRHDFNEFVESNLIREDFLNGVTYKPTKKIDVHIERGSTSVFDKHIAFGEIKTMDDLVTYKNGSFFPINES